MASSSSSAQSTLASSSRSCNYDVFLSFRGEDTRKTFVDHLYSDLTANAIHTYKDDEKLPRGESIRPSLFKAIKDSHIAVIIFSKNYANSSWCLDELTYIMKCKDKRGLIVMPVFYDVEPTEVRKQKGKFEEAFGRHEKENTSKVESWRKALVAAGEISGWETNKIADGHETAVIKIIVNEILKRLPSFNTCVDDEFVGMTTRIRDLKSQLEIGSAGVIMVGIWGVGGGGKTTLATSIHMEISHQFQANCIVENIREKSSKDGLEKLQESILSAVDKTGEKVHSVVQGKQKIKSRLCRRKVLLLLDDIDQIGQLEALAGSHDWFGSGSRIIITTRNQHLLEAHKVDKVCRVTLLSPQEASMLFDKHACNKEERIEDYERLSLRVVSYAAGLPLALKVLGSFLYGKNKDEWMSALDRLKEIPEKEIVEKLKISYDGLAREEKELFLDIACFFRGSSSKDNLRYFNAWEILETCFHFKIGIKVLSDKALINIDAEGRFEMHDLIQEMAHYIVTRDHPSNPECHSRIWKKEEIRNLRLWEATEKNDKIEAIGRYEIHGVDNVSRLCKNVSNMKNLRWLHVCSHDGSYDRDGGPYFLSNELRYINWTWYPGSSFPNSFQPKKLVCVKLSYSTKIKQLWEGYKDLPSLKVLELISMENLVSTPDFDGLRCLQKLTLKGCFQLEEIHPSLGNHTSLEYVQVLWCEKLTKFPTIVQMRKLQTLEINHCPKIQDFPEIQTKMESLVNLSLREIGIGVLPASIGKRCTNLTSLSVKDCRNLKSIEFNMDALRPLKTLDLRGTQLLLPEKRLHWFSCTLRKLYLGGFNLEDGKFVSGIVGLSNLEELSIDECNLEGGKFLCGIVELSNLKELHLLSNDFSRLDFSLLQLTRLKNLTLYDCKKLVELPELPSSVARLRADLCDSLTAIGDSLTNCRCLCHVSILGGGIINDGKTALESMLQGNIENGTMRLTLKGGLDIAKCFTPGVVRKGNKFRLQLEENWRNQFCGFLMCAVGHRVDPYAFGTRIVMKSGLTDSRHEVDWNESSDDVVWEESDGDRETWVAYISFASLANTPWWNQTHNELSIGITGGHRCINGFGVRLVSKKGESGSRPKDPSQFSKYAPVIEIDNISTYDLKIGIPQ